MANDPNHKRVLELCDEALALPREERESFVEKSCADNNELRAAVDSVLLAIGDSNAFLDDEPETLPNVASLVGQQIDTYTLKERLGEGGMGTVYLAERRAAEYTQRVALKVVRRNLLAPE